MRLNEAVIASVAALTLEAGCAANTHQRVTDTLTTPGTETDCSGPQQNDATDNICGIGPNGEWNFTTDLTRGWDETGNWLIVNGNLTESAVVVSPGIYHYVGKGGNPWKATEVTIGDKPVLVHERRRSWDE